MKTRIALVGLIALALMVAAAGGYAFWNGRDQDMKYRLAKVERGPLTAATSASGTLNAVTTVQVGSQVSGQIREMLVDFNSEVKKDQVIARIDPDTFETRVAQAEADLEVAKASVLVQRAALERVRSDLETARANLGALRAQTTKAEIALADAEREMQRKKSLAERGFGSMSERDKTQATFEGSNAQVRTARAQEQAQVSGIRSAEAQVKSAEAQVVNSEAQVKQREAALRQARVDLDRTYIRAPVSGVVILRNVDAGQTVAASLQAPILFTIAQDLRAMQVETSVDEADVGRIRESQRATFTVDAFPGRQFQGEVKQIRKSPQIVQNVVTYTVIVSAENPDLALLPGMTANVRVINDSRESTLRVPNAALRFRPPGASEASPGPAAAPSPAAAPAGSAGGGNQMAQLRERLVKDLELDETQQGRLDQILGQVRQKVMAVMADANLSEAEKRQRIERARADSRNLIGDILNPSQKTKYEQMQAVQAARGQAGGTQGRVYVVGKDGQPEAVQLRLGLSDGNFTEILSGNLEEGAEVITAVQNPVRAGAGAGLNLGGPRLRL